MTNARTEAREKSRQLIIDTAMRLFATTGYEKTSIRLIASTAGISVGLMYNYFDSKEALLKAIFLQGMQDISATMPEAASAAGDPLVGIRSLINSCFTLLPEHMDFWRLFYAIRMQPEVLNVLHKELEEWGRAIYSQLEDLFSRAGSSDPVAEARILQATIDGIGQQMALAQENYPYEIIRKTLIEKYS